MANLALIISPNEANAPSEMIRLRIASVSLFTRANCFVLRSPAPAWTSLQDQGELNVRTRVDNQIGFFGDGPS